MSSKWLHRRRVSSALLLNFVDDFVGPAAELTPPTILVRRASDNAGMGAVD